MTALRRPPAATAATVTQKEREAALALVSDWADNATADGARLSTLQQLELSGLVAGAFAEARVGAFVPGARHDVGTVLDVHASHWRTADGELTARRHVRRHWAARLTDQHLRPLFWPPVTVTFRRWRDASLDGAPPTFGDPFVDCEEADADMVRLSISGPAVAE